MKKSLRLLSLSPFVLVRVVFYTARALYLLLDAIPIYICMITLYLSYILFFSIFYMSLFFQHQPFDFVVFDRWPSQVLLLCLCFPGPPDEHQIVQFILAFKGTASISDGAGQVIYGIITYYLCVRLLEQSSKSTCVYMCIYVDMYMCVSIYMSILNVRASWTYMLKTSSFAPRPEAPVRAVPAPALALSTWS